MEELVNDMADRVHDDYDRAYHKQFTSEDDRYGITCAMVLADYIRAQCFGLRNKRISQDAATSLLSPTEHGLQDFIKFARTIDKQDYEARPQSKSKRGRKSSNLNYPIRNDSKCSNGDNSINYI